MKTNWKADSINNARKLTEYQRHHTSVNHRSTVRPTWPIR